MEAEKGEMGDFDEAETFHYLEALMVGLMFQTTCDDMFVCKEEDMENIVVPFMENGGLLVIFLAATQKWYAKHDKKGLVLSQVTKLLWKANNSLSYLDRERVSDWHGRREEFEREWGEKSLEVCSFIMQIDHLIKQEAKEVFQLPKSQLSNTLMSHQILGIFVDFLRSSFDELLRSKINVSEEMFSFAEFKVALVKKKIESLSLEIERVEEVREGLCFLLTFLGDEPLQHNKFEKVKELWVDIEVLANKAGEICYMIFVDKRDGDVNRALSELLRKIDLTHQDIKDYVNSFKPEISKVLRTDDFLMGFASSILEHIQELLKYRTELIHPLKNEIEMLGKELMSLESFVLKIKKRLAENEEDWRDLTSRVLDIIDITEYVISCFEVQGSPMWYYQIRLLHIVEEIKIIKMQMDDIEEINKCNDGLSEDIAETSVEKSSQVDSSVRTKVMVDCVCETTIKDHLIVGERKLELISIVGMPGLGKTTLAKKLFNDPVVLKKFYPCGWCRVSRGYNHKILLRDILDSINRLDDEVKEMNEGQLADTLYKNLKGSKYLIVLDDIWNTDPWDDCQMCFPDDGFGSRIIFTSRMEDIQLQGKPLHTPYKLPFLSPDDSWYLLKHNVFQDGEFHDDFEEVGKIIAERCQGLPLAVNLIAGHLRAKERKVSLWEEVSASYSAYIGDDQNMGEKLLEHIYKHLPDSLKPCMMYCAGFPEKNEIKVQKLMRLWIAEGFIQKTSKHASLEKVAEITLADLINRSLVIAVDRSANGRIKTCILHSWLHDFFLRKAQEENFLKRIDSPLSAYESHHRLAIVDQTCPDRMGIGPFSPHARSLLCLFNHVRFSAGFDRSYIYNGLKLLNVLDLESISIMFVPNNINRLVLLKYLAVRGDFESIPLSIGSLWNLETLIVKAPLTCLPEAILGMIKLKHLLIKSKKATLASLYNHQALNLKTVQTLGTVYINSPEDKEALTNFQNVREMKCIFTGIKIGSKYCFHALDFLNHLEILHLSFYESWAARNHKVATLSLPPSVKQLTLSEFCLPWKQMSVLAKSMPKLEVLKLVNNAFEGEECDMDSDEVEFSELKFFKLKGINIRNWNISCSADAFPKLECLVIKYCNKLRKIPSSFVDNEKLRLILLEGCKSSVEKSANQIKEEQQDYGNKNFEVVTRPSDGRWFR
ncbi:hypothetical protein BVRB_5g105960 [Beta vulgaris subsp. vulgaris]|nr:hypothetical protein BVRB_5g105960 [Beta vulgaris subsp. vulgaris]